VVDGLPAGLELGEPDIQADLDRRRPGQSPLHSPRSEPDSVRILSGLFQGKTTGTPLAMLVENRDARSEDYTGIGEMFRPGHADYTWEKKFLHRDHRGGGRASGRETVARVAAGAVARKLLAGQGIRVIGAVAEIGGIQADLASHDWEASRGSALRCPDTRAAARMEKAISEVKQDGDSLGGVVEIRALGVPAGLGEPVFDKLDALLGRALLSIGAVKGVEVGDGFSLARLRGSESNDAMETPGRFTSNRAGGILGGISSGEEIVLRAAVKPTPSIAKPQKTVDRQGVERELALKGRHDPCLVPRLVAVAEAMVCLVLADVWLQQRARQGITDEGGGP